MVLYRFFIIVICIFCLLPLQAQIETVPLSYNHIIAQAKDSWPTQKRSISLDTLPFVDDFALSGPFPNPDLWVDNDVFINATLAKDPPSLGVATFDGLDNTGSPYNRSGGSDTLTSVSIVLDAATAQDLYISYFVQARGFGDQPEFVDSLILEFKDTSGVWVRQKEYAGTDVILSLESVAFIFDFVEIGSVRFLHPDFQFRFRNTSSGRGAADLWHLDVVRVINNQLPSQTFQDIAFQFPSQGILDRYSAMPIRHFRSGTSGHLRNTFDIDIFNHFDVPRPVGSDASVMEVNELNSGQNVVAPIQFLTGANLNIGADTSLSIIVEQDISVSTSIANSSDQLLFETMFTIDPIVADNDPGLFNNNFISTQTVIDDYFAYDDGSAELSIIAQGSGTNIAVEFETSVLDTLSAIQFHFPHVSGDVTNQFFNLKVWLNDLTSEPVFEGELLNPIYVDDFSDTLQGFTTYRLQESFTGIRQPVVIPANTTFFVGWEQVSNEFIDAIPVGFDTSTDNVAQYNFFSTDEEEWFDFESADINGAFLIRPVMGVENAIFTSVQEEVGTSSAVVYPNPSSGLIHIQLKEVENLSAWINVVDFSGRTVYSQPFDSETVQLGNLATGLYFLSLVDENQNIFYREKIIIQEN